MAILTRAGRTMLAQTIAQTSIYLAWGRGASQWQMPPAEPIAATNLADPIGYRKAKKVGFCYPDDQGDIFIQGGRFSLSSEPTQHIYCEFTFDFTDGAGETVRELGLMSGLQADAQLPDGLVYLTPEQVANSGTLLLLEHRAPLIREQGVRESFEFVVSF
ncbi:hypothetical protein JF50_06210 [Pseudoalteromonas luteoviolacea]|uniref:Uncharacterized protein n=1 Tax=Pseudoalteromonas luteoviolacea TaxID=43657 RepID=A0A0C1MMI7_9GAMM|nr:hypothetical protein [Pseudoalteromonas luteoviolacea]KID58269.1 hypothetical protein JF50_06210 [Pseudoalteromonas luteoviolacea]